MPALQSPHLGPRQPQRPPRQRPRQEIQCGLSGLVQRIAPAELVQWPLKCVQVRAERHLLALHAPCAGRRFFCGCPLVRGNSTLLPACELASCTRRCARSQWSSQAPWHAAVIVIKGGFYSLLRASPAFCSSGACSWPPCLCDPEQHTQLTVYGRQVGAWAHWPGHLLMHLPTWRDVCR